MSPAAKHPLLILAFLAPLATAWPMLACAQNNNVLNIIGVDPISLVSWNGSGGLTGEDDYCVVSYESFGNGNFEIHRQYDVAAYANGYMDADGDFALENASGDQLKVSLSWRGNNTGGNFVTLRPYESSGDVMDPQNGALDCGDPNASATIRIDISATALASTQAGTYTGTFQIDAWQFDGNNRYPSSGPIRQSFSVTIPELTQITNLDDIDLGSFDGVNDLTQSDDICIFRNGFGSFRIKASGGPSDGDPFLLSNGASQIPYLVAFKDDSMASLVSLTEGQWLAGLNGHGSQNCGGGTNASIQVTAIASDMETATPGTYAGTLYLTAEPD